MPCANYGRYFRFKVNKRFLHSFIHEELAKLIMTCEHNLKKNIKGNISLPLPSVTNGWEDDMKKWPRITYGNIFTFFVESVACDEI